MAPRHNNDNASRRNASSNGPVMLGNYEPQPSRNASAPMATFRGNPTDNSYAPKGDSYRPNNSFDFRVEAPGNVSFDRAPPDSYRPQRRDRRHGDRHGARRRGPEGRRPFLPKIAADRPFLSGQREPTPEMLPGMVTQGPGAHAFRNPDELSDSAEEAMNTSDSDDSDSDSDTDSEEEDGPPRKKQARVEESKAADGDSVPRWSNPDPYTALPPPDSSRRTGANVLKMIRKGKIAQEADAAKREADTSDFISFDFGDDKESEESEAEEEDESEPVVLGKRKRTMDEMIRGVASLKPLKAPSKGVILKEWLYLGQDKSEAAPWCTVDHSNCANVGVWLHREIIDFYNFVSPRKYEETVRARLIVDLDDVLKAEWKGARVRCFGSYASGLYLPTADMDLVVTSQYFEQRGIPVHDKKKDLYKLRDVLYRKRLALPDSVEVIAKARVPIVKYVDRLTGLKVDVSFESNTGLVAVDTFLAWKRQYPAMPILATVVKHFLAMRGLNEPVNGGIGGFSIICLVVSLLEHLPQLQSRNMIAEHHLGEVLMEFFQFYGRYFNPLTTAIQLNPPAWINKNYAGVEYKHNSMDRLSIIDPNNSFNDISGGASNTSTILRVFREAFEDLSAAMQTVSDPKNESSSQKPRSILGAILSGNYNTFFDQREILRQVDENDRKARR